MTFKDFVGAAWVALIMLSPIILLVIWFVVENINNKVKDIQKNINEICDKVKNIDNKI